jgi:hypothetical protein
MNKFIQEDWERALELDQMYLKEMEFQEMEELAQWSPEKPPAKINFKLPKIAKNANKRAKKILI